ncbi:MAG: ferredoxin--NADP reductase, partial [Hyphomicrobium sp.]
MAPAKRGPGNLLAERVLEITHYTGKLFSFRTTRSPSFRFESGQFAMIGLEADGRPLLRAY